MAISFNDIPSTLRVPWCYIEFDNSGAIQGDTVQPYTILVLGQKLAAGTAEVEKPVLVTSEAQANTLFGEGSMLAQMVEACRKADSFTEMYCLPLEDDSAGVAATGAITLSGMPTASGTLCIYIGGKRITSGVTASQSLANVAEALASAINAETSLCVTAEADDETSGKVNLTCKWKGLTGNDIDVRLNYYSGEDCPTGLQALVTAMSGGTSNPDISDALANLGDFTHYNIVIMPYTDGNNLKLLDEELDDRWGPMRQLEGLAFCSYKGTLGELSTFGNGNNTQNLCVIPDTDLPTPTWEVAANAAGLAVLSAAAALLGLL